jgi:hypothetical protein
MYRSATPTTFYMDVYIDTEEIISAFTASGYLYYHRVESTSVDKDAFIVNFYDNILSSAWVISHDVTTSTYFIIQVQHTHETSTGAYIDIYLSPSFKQTSSFDGATSCRFGNVANSATCTVV